MHGQALWTPAQLSAALWLDASDASTITLNGSTVSQWRDKSGNGNHANQAVAANQPEIGVFTQNGLSLITVRNRAKFMSVTNSPNMLMGFGVVNTRNTTSLSDILVIGSTSSNTHEFFIRNGAPQISFDGLGSTKGKYNIDGGAFSGFAEDHTASSLGCHIWGGVFESSNSLNNIISRTALNVSSIGADVGEILWFSSELSNTDRQKLEGYLAWKWGAVANLPSNHPYRYDGTLFGYSRLWTPAELGVSLALWLDADDTSTITLNGATVSQWRDKSGNARHANQTVATSQPAYNATTKTITFEGSSTKMQLAIAIPGAPYDIATVVKPLASTAGYRTLLQVQGLTNTHTLIRETGSTRIGTWFNAFRQFGTYTLDGTARAILFARLNSDLTMNASLNGDIVLTSPTAPVGAATSSGIWIGNTWADYQPWGDVNEMILTSGILSTSDRQKLEGYLAWKWGTVASLPSDHPYKNGEPTV